MDNTDWNKKLGIFIHIPKAGGTSVYSSFFPDIVRYGERECHSTALRLKGKLNKETWDKLHKISWVRNPWARACSLWRYTKRHTPRHTLNFKEWLLNPEVDFHCQEFDNPPFYERSPLSALTYLTDLDGNVLVDFIGRLEFMSEDVNKINNKFNKNFKTMHLNNQLTGDEYQKHYDKELKNYIGDICSWEIKEFNYNFKN